MDLIKGCAACVFQNITFMIPAGLLYMLVRDLLGGGVSGARTAFYIAGCVVCVGLILLSTWFQYNATYFATYTESGVRRITLAEKLRKIPLSFFGKKDLADLTSTIMADCTFLEQSFSHFIPELFGSIKTHPAEQIKAWLAEAGLEICGYHTQVAEIREDIDAVIAYNRTLGNRFVIVPAPAGPMSTAAEWHAFSRELNGYKNTFAAAGFRFGFHSHRNEVLPVDDGSLPWDIVAADTDDDFILQIDMGNTLSGGVRPEELYKKYASRGITVHYKPYSLETGFDAVIGTDDIDWNGIIAVTKSVPACEWAIVEHEKGVLSDVAKCAEALRKMI